MIRSGRLRYSKWSIGLAALWALSGPGCGKPEVKTTEIPGPYEEATLIAVAPALNFAGNTDFDPVRAADFLSSELTHVLGVQVIGVNRVMAALVRQGAEEVTSPAQALDLCEMLGCDGIVVFAITEYDAYTPVVGMAAQLYVRTSGALGNRLDPVAASRQASPLPVETGADSPLKPRAQIQRVYNAAHECTAEAVRKYAEVRDVGSGALGWRKYLKSQRLFLRFCCHQAVNELMGQEYYRVIAHNAVEE